MSRKRKDHGLVCVEVECGNLPSLLLCGESFALSFLLSSLL